MDKRKIGIYGKYLVQRMDGQDMPGEKHVGCKLFVLDITHDPFALPAIQAYAKACLREYPVLSADLTAWIIEQKNKK